MKHEPWNPNGCPVCSPAYCEVARRREQRAPKKRYRYHAGTGYRQTSARTLASGNTLTTFHNLRTGWWAAVVYGAGDKIVASKEAKSRALAVGHALHEEV